MKRGKIGAGLIVLLCGGELLIAIAIGGAGAGALFGVEGLLVSATLVVVIGAFLFQRHRRLAAESVR